MIGNAVLIAQLATGEKTGTLPWRHV